MEIWELRMGSKTKCTVKTIKEWILKASLLPVHCFYTPLIGTSHLYITRNKVP